MNDKRRGLGRGLGALIPNASESPRASRPTDVFFTEQKREHDVDSTKEAAERASRFSDALNPQPTTQGARLLDFETGDTADVSRETTSDAAADSNLAPVPGATFAELSPRLIRPNPKQPRSVFDEQDMSELVHSIREIGVLQPIVVRPVPADDPEHATTPYELIMGERRWRATQQAGLDVVPVIIRSTTDEDLLRDALLENLHRSQLNPLEEAAAYQQLLEDFGCTHDELAERIGRSRPQISNTIRLMKLPPLVQRRVAAGVISAGHARALLGMKDTAAMERLAQRVVAEGLSVRATEEIVAVGDDVKPRRQSAPRATNPEFDDLVNTLADRLDTRVGITMGKTKGKLTVEFASAEDLDRIMTALGIDRG